MTISNAFLAPHDTSKLRARSPSISSVSSVSTSTSSRLYPRPSISTSRTITSLTPSRSTVPRRKSSTSSTTSTASTATTATSMSLSQKGENVQVCVRCRPMTQHEFLNKTDHCWEVDPAASRIRLSENGLASRRQQGRQREHYYGKSCHGMIPCLFHRLLTFVLFLDHVFSGSDNEELYQTSIRHLVE